MGSDNIMRVVWFTIFLLLVLLTTVVNAGEDDDHDKRCRYFSLFKACKIGCKVLGHTTARVIKMINVIVQKKISTYLMMCQDGSMNYLMWVRFSRDKSTSSKDVLTTGNWTKKSKS